MRKKDVINILNDILDNNRFGTVLIVDTNNNFIEIQTGKIRVFDSYLLLGDIMVRYGIIKYIN